jgi:hypothetical protein
MPKTGLCQKVLWRNHLIVIMTLARALPLPLWHFPIAIVPYYVFTIVEKFPVQGIPGHRKGGDHHVKRGFLKSTKKEL